MTRRNTLGSLCMLLASMPILFSSAVLAADTPEAVVKKVYKSVPAERAVGGMTAEARLAEIAQLHEQVSALVPRGVAAAGVSVEISDQDRQNLAPPLANPAGGAPMRIGVVKSVAPAVVGIDHRGVMQEDADGGFVWAISFSSPDAGAIRLHVANFSLTHNAKMYFLDQAGNAFGPYEAQGRNNNGDFWTRSIPSDTGTILLRVDGPVSDQDRRNISFVIDKIAHISKAGRNPNPMPDPQSHDSWPCADNASCVVDANCGSVGPAAPAKDAIAKYEWIQGPFVNTCTGGLIADTDSGSQRALFLTANHCLSKNQSNMETWFNYETSGCNGTCPHNILTGGAPPSDTIGFTVLASGRDGDFTLGELNQAPPAGAVFLGWTNTPIAFTNGADLHRISNPNFGPQAYSMHDVDTGAGTCNGLPRGEMIYSNDAVGATMGGSSGSPVVNSSSQIVGQLFGCCGFNCGDVCDSGSNSTIDGALAHYFANVEPFLDPQGGGGCSTDPECDDGDACNGAETCVGGSCQNGTPPPCQNGDGCCPSGCNTGNDDDCVSCGANKAPCTQNSDCCSNNCKNGSCRGN